MIKKYEWIKEGVYCIMVVHTLNEGFYAEPRLIEAVHINSVRFTDGNTAPKANLLPLIHWVQISEITDEVGEALFKNKTTDTLIGYYNEESNSVEGEGVMMYDITHFATT